MLSETQKLVKGQVLLAEPRPLQDVSKFQSFMKRALDLLASGVALALLSPLLLMIALAIKVDSRGPVLFRQRRLGQADHPFCILKFRTMVVQEDGPVIVQACLSDPRVTRVGRFLRKSSL